MIRVRKAVIEQSRKALGYKNRNIKFRYRFPDIKILIRFQIFIILAYLLPYLNPNGFVQLKVYRIKPATRRVECVTVLRMIKAAEQRTDRRYACNARIKWTQLNRVASTYGDEVFYGARVLNFSKSGLYFETGHPLKPGITILFRLEGTCGGVSHLEDGECLRMISLAEVKWCRDMVSKGESFFGIGARYPIHY